MRLGLVGITVTCGHRAAFVAQPSQGMQTLMEAAPLSLSTNEGVPDWTSWPALT